jgi:aminoglycoside 3-N-acetyltransferase
MRSHYRASDITQALVAADVRRGDTIFSHISLLKLGLIGDARTPQEMVATFTSAITNILGPEGCFITPSYSYSFCKGEPFNLSTTPSDVGPFSNQLLQEPKVQRSREPIFSVAALGNVGDLFADLPHSCFGADCIYDRLLKRQGKIVNFGLSLSYLTPIHHLEYTIGVPYRFDKPFRGQIKTENGHYVEEEWLYYVRNLDQPSQPDCSELEREGQRGGLVQKAKLGLGYVTSVSVDRYFSLADKMISLDPWYLTVNGNWRSKQ